MDDFPETYDRVVELAEKEELTGMEVAKGTYLATKLFATGSRTLPYVEGRFRAAKLETDASIAGLYMSVHGKDAHLAVIQRDLESNSVKRAWLRRDVGTEQSFFNSLESGGYWADFLPILPSASGVRKLTRSCMASSDTLVRRAGMLWGYFFADAAYAASLKAVAENDADPVTRRIALRVQQRQAANE